MSHQLPPLPEPTDYQFQHEDTGQISTVDGQQVEWGFEKNNPRWQRIGGSYSEAQMRAYAELAIAEKDAEILRLHVKLAGETLRADQGWDRYEAANRMCQNQQAYIASVKREPLSEQQINDVMSTVMKITKTNDDGSMHAKCGILDFVRAVEQFHGIGAAPPAPGTEGG